MSVFRVILVRIFPHSNWTRKDTPYLSVFSPNAGKWTRITSNTDTFHAVVVISLKPRRRVHKCRMALLKFRKVYWTTTAMTSFYPKRAPPLVFYDKFCENFQSRFFTEYLQLTNSETRQIFRNFLSLIFA